MCTAAAGVEAQGESPSVNSPTERTLRMLRASGYICAVVEKWNPHTKTRHDLYGFADILAIHEQPPGEILAVQVTSGNNHAAHKAKILKEPRHRSWLMAGGRIALISWTKHGPRGKRKLWAPRIERIT